LFVSSFDLLFCFIFLQNLSLCFSFHRAFRCVCRLLKEAVVKSSHPQHLNTTQQYNTILLTFLFKVFFIPVIVTPEYFVLSTSSLQISSDNRRALTLVAKGTSLTCYWLLFDVSTSTHLKSIFVSPFNFLMCFCVVVSLYVLCFDVEIFSMCSEW
jgi:hypothetical protein